MVQECENIPAKIFREYSCDQKGFKCHRRQKTANLLVALDPRKFSKYRALALAKKISSNFHLVFSLGFRIADEK